MCAFGVALSAGSLMCDCSRPLPAGSLVDPLWFLETWVNQLVNHADVLPVTTVILAAVSETTQLVLSVASMCIFKHAHWIPDRIDFYPFSRKPNDIRHSLLFVIKTENYKQCQSVESSPRGWGNTAPWWRNTILKTYIIKMTIIGRPQCVSWDHFLKKSRSRPCKPMIWYTK